MGKKLPFVPKVDKRSRPWRLAIFNKGRIHRLEDKIQALTRDVRLLQRDVTKLVNWISVSFDFEAPRAKRPMASKYDVRLETFKQGPVPGSKEADL